MEMKKKRKLRYKIGALLCALVVVVSSMGVESYYARDIVFNENGLDLMCDYSESAWHGIRDVEYPVEVQEQFANYKYYIFYSLGSFYKLVFSNSKPYLSYFYSETTKGYHYKATLEFPDYENDLTFTYSVDNSEWILETSNSSGVYGLFFIRDLSSRDDIDFSSDKVLDLNFDLCFESGELFLHSFVISDVYDFSLGYLQNVRMNTVFDDVPLGENVGETYTTRWYYEQYSTSGIDLTSGDYLIRYYQERWIVKGYGEDDVVEKSDRYVLGDYIVQNGYIETYSEDIDSVLQGQGYKEPSFFDLLWNKFVTTHYYFQIVDTKNNEVGGLLHIYLTDDNGKFGVEHIGETLDDKGEYDEDGYKDFIDEDSITSDDVEGGFEDLENGTVIDFGTVQGSDEFASTLEVYANEISNVTQGVSVLFAEFPPWMLGLLGVSFVLLIIGIVVKTF